MSALIRAAIPTPEPVLLAAMKNILKINSTTDDAFINQLIQSAREYAETITERALVRTTYTQYLDHFPLWRTREFGSYQAGLMHSSEHFHHRHGEIKIKRPPLISVQKVVYIDTTGNPQQLNPGTDFVVDPATEPGRIRPIPYTVWPLTMHTENAVAIFFTAGYAAAGTSEPETEQPPSEPTPPEQEGSYIVDRSMPAVVVTAIQQLVAHWYFNREPVAAGSVGVVPNHVDALLSSQKMIDYAPTPG